MLFANWQLDKEWLDKIYDLSAHKDLITFDIFDTCLTRDVDSPVDIFAKIEKIFSQKSEYASGFAQIREDAEQLARNSIWEKFHKHEITYDDIYQHMSSCSNIPQDDIKRAQKLELKIEKESLYAVPDILELTKYLVQNKIPYAFVSDMYLPKEFLSEVLKEKGFSGWEELIVSSEFGKQKHQVIFGQYHI